MGSGKENCRSENCDRTHGGHEEEYQAQEATSLRDTLIEQVNNQSHESMEMCGFTNTQERTTFAAGAHRS